ncbi:MarR family winged helix-turn-helix transcriptional regulator [Aeromicrobium sp. Leaf350]|uniref:MarR family winged helix-turn-helix transcriptional regulator n=1 Tax=Aeromicrobium sp. Leaf350 TaxID=2876565 RepID=UPI0021045AF8|nr:MarR family transcriptional regulator [Aeromicrobium sp. Leaf350]
MTTARLDDQLCFALYAASRRLTTAYRGTLTELGLTYPQYLALMVLWEDDGITVSALGERLSLDSGTLSPLLKRLQVQGLVERRPSTEDERRVHVHLTDAGRELSAEVGRLQQCVADAIDLDADEFVALRALARRVADLEPLQS